MRCNVAMVICIEERCGDIVVEGGVGQIVIAMKTFKQSSGIQTWGAYALCRILYRNSECNILWDQSTFPNKTLSLHWHTTNSEYFKIHEPQSRNHITVGRIFVCTFVQSQFSYLATGFS